MQFIMQHCRGILFLKRACNHKFDIAHFVETFTNVSKHTILLDILLKIFSFMPIENVSNDWKRILKETTWMHVLDTISPNEMNSKVSF